ncbi:MAG TPA: HD domain-containing protein [Bacteroidales bacterium]
MNLIRLIESAENKYKQILEEYFLSVYDEKSLSSHGIDHHRRVWGYSKELLQLKVCRTAEKISQLPSKLIIACYLHDIGMSVNPGTKHGKHSRKLCLQFLTKNNLPESDFYDVLEAIEYHDNKDYNNKLHSNDLLTILSVSDDLDAFGFSGIFRYAEIYLTRGINPEKIGYLIRENSKKRLDNFAKKFGYDSEIVKKHIKRYYTLDNFFEKYNEQLPSYHFDTKNPSGFCGVIEIIMFLMKNNLQFKDFIKEAKKYSDDPVNLWFFEELEKELSGSI